MNFWVGLLGLLLGMLCAALLWWWWPRLPWPRRRYLQPYCSQQAEPQERAAPPEVGVP